MVNIVNELWNDFVSLVFPENCLGCHRLLVKGEEHLCTYCRYDLPIAATENNNSLKNKFAHEPSVSFVKAFLPFRKFGATQTLLHQLKYKGQYEIGVMLGRWFGEHLLTDPDFPKFDCLLAVPLHPEKLKIRGYNQSEAIAKGLTLATGIEGKHHLIKRVKFTSTQTRKRKLERWQNVSEIFQVNSTDELKGSKVLLVDDVLTTGSTLSSCASALVSNGVSEVGICTLAYA